MPDRDLAIEHLQRRVDALERVVKGLQAAVAKLQIPSAGGNTSQALEIDHDEDTLDAESDVDPNIVAGLSIEKLDISEGAKAWLRKHRHKTVGSIKSLTRGQCLSGGISQAHLREIERVLSSLGTSLLHR